MKINWIIIFLFSINYTYGQYQVIAKLKIHEFNFTTNENASKNISQKLHQAITQTVLYSVNGTEHLVSIPVDSIPNAPIHLIKKNDKWILESFYPNLKMDGARNYFFVDTLGNFVYANHGSEIPNPWPLGDLVSVNTIGEKLNLRKINSAKAFYHSVGAGDLNEDGLFDVVGLHMFSTYWGDNLHPFIQNKDSTFQEARDLINMEGLVRYSAGAVLVDNVLGDKSPEIIKGTYGYTGSNGEKRYAFEIFGLNKNNNTYQRIYEPKQLGIFSYLTNGGMGTTSIKSGDFDKNGFKDLAICSEGTLPHGKNGSAIQIWLNNGAGEFIPDQYILNNADDSLNIREFEVGDIDSDGWPDIVMHGMGGVLFRSNIPDKQYSYYFKLNNLIWKNTKGEFNILKNQLNVFDTKNPGLIGNSNFLKGFVINGKLKFIGFENGNSNGINNFYEIIVDFCNGLVKPNFNTSKYSFCSGDSLKLSITNVNKGDTLKWYFGTKSDLSNVANKTFTDSTKLFVTRTDSVGCIVSSDTIQITKNSIPIAPGISRDSDNNLVANSNGITWYKDGVKITDTTQKIKPTSNGNYTATTTQNGCTSPASTNYYYLTSAVANLTSDEYFKVSPNPTDGEIYLNYNIRSSRDVFISVIDMSGRTIISNRKVNSGNKLNLGTTMKGNYIIQVKDKSGRLLTTEKLIKN
jgi:hypothetical protein